MLGLIVKLSFEMVDMFHSKDKEQIQSVQNNSAHTKLYENAESVKETVIVNTQILEDGFRNMGTLITEEYYFTQVEDYKNKQKVFEIFDKTIDSTAYLTFSYDGVVNAGIDCEKIVVNKDEENKKIEIAIPKAEIIDVVIDHNSFKAIKEKNGIVNKVDMNMMNDSLKQFEESAREKAMEKKILEKADEYARKMIESFVNSVVDVNEYQIVYVEKQ